MRQSPLFKALSSLTPWFVLVIAYLVVAGPYLLDSTFWFDRDRDNAILQFNSFSYWAGSIEHGFGFPKWYPHAGGSPIGLGALSWKPFLPHRFIGYILACVTPWSYLALFKISLFSGLLISSLGWFLFLRDVFKNKWVAFFGTIPVVFGGFGTTIFHQEYILGHLNWVPWLLLAARRVPQNPKLAVLIAAVLGVGMTDDYPHFLAFGAGFFGLVLFVTSPEWRHKILQGLRWKGSPKIVAASLAAVMLCATPLLFVATQKNDYSSPIRGGESTGYNTLKEYEVGMMAPSVSFERMKQYLSPKKDLDDDAFALFVGRTIIALGLVVFSFFSNPCSLRLRWWACFSGWSLAGTATCLRFSISSTSLSFTSFGSGIIFSLISTGP